MGLERKFKSQRFLRLLKFLHADFRGDFPNAISGFIGLILFLKSNSIRHKK